MEIKKNRTCHSARTAASGSSRAAPAWSRCTLPALLPATHTTSCCQERLQITLSAAAHGYRGHCSTHARTQRWYHRGHGRHGIGKVLTRQHGNTSPTLNSLRMHAPGAGTTAAMEDTTTMRQRRRDSRKGSAARVSASGPSTFSSNMRRATSADTSSTAACWLAPADGTPARSARTFPARRPPTRPQPPHAGSPLQTRRGQEARKNGSNKLALGTRKHPCRRCSPAPSRAHQLLLIKRAAGYSLSGIFQSLQLHS